jgi:hypothetical protein
MPALARLVAFGRHAVVLWLLFALVHAWLGMLNLVGPGQPFGDVELVYRFWVERGLQEGQWVGIDTSWVYPLLALVPMIAAYVAGPEFYGAAWLSIVTALNAAAFVAIIGVQARVPSVRATIAAGWMLFLLLLGPIALGRLDAVTVAVALVAAALAFDHPRWAGTLLAVGAWIKIWPAALLLAALVALRRRRSVLLGALVVCIVVTATGLALGAGGALISAVVEHSTRGLQVESPVATAWLWAGIAEVGGARVYYDTSLLTFQVLGEGTALAADLTTPLLALAVLAVAALGVLAMRAGATQAYLLPVLGLALVMTLILVNKVGSPQFASWIAVPVILGLLARERGGASFLVPAVLALVIAGLTQLVYPVLYDRLLALDPALVLILTLRNVLYAVLWGWAVVRLTALAHGPRSGTSYDSRMTVDRASS